MVSSAPRDTETETLIASTRMVNLASETFHFEILETNAGARRGRLTTGRGVIETPALIAAAPLGAVEAVSAGELETAGVAAIAVDLYHLSLRPGLSAIADLGGLNAFCAWRGPLLADGGGRQIGELARVEGRDGKGILLRNHLDGTRMRVEPRELARAQRQLGTDLASTLDDATSKPSPELTLAWAEAARRAWPSGAGGLFASFPRGELETAVFERAVATLADLDFDGFAIDATTGFDAGLEALLALPRGRPRYLTGARSRRDILCAVEHGADLVAAGPFFDGAVPRNGTVFTPEGPLHIADPRYRRDGRPLAADCSCAFCRRHDRAYLHYLIGAGELSGAVYAGLHNLRQRLDFMAELRQRIAFGNLASLVPELAILPTPPSTLEAKPDRR